MKTIYSIEYKKVEINFLKDKDFVGYNFKVKDKTYGYKVPLKTKKQVEIFSAITALTLSAIESVNLKLK